MATIRTTRLPAARRLFQVPLAGLERAAGWRMGMLLAILLAVGELLRLAALAIPAEAANDEIFQYLEQAHRFVFGYGVIPWEYRVGLRNAIIPDMLAVPMWFGALIAPQSQLYLALPRITMTIASLAVVASAFLLGARISRLHAGLAGLVTAIWPVIVYYGAHPLSEAVALALFVPAAAILIWRPALGGAWVTAGGALLTLCCIARLQMVPAAFVVMVGVLVRRSDRPRLLPFAAGCLAALLLSAAVDLASGFVPFAWIYRNVWINIGQHVAARFGVNPPYFYFAYLALEWGPAALPIAILALVGARRCPILLLAALAHLLVHSAIGHKETRFILLVECVAVLLASFGTADLLHMLAAGRSRRWRTAAYALAATLWCWAAVSVAANEMNRYRWAEGSNRLRITRDAVNAGPLCGLALYRTAGFLDFGGYVTLHRDVPIYLYAANTTLAEEKVESTLAAERGRFNTIIAPQRAGIAPPAGFRLAGCRRPIVKHPGEGDTPQDATLCAWRRSGGCAATGSSRYEINRVLAEIGG